ncbi:exported hypothetical protein [uncultured Desulfobacterium sp.]|uniref:Uncharacterized protein n=1 Tax=uncultured Desulfobacterium sp. TaxID=201089 RepID=A0A445MZP3_9BACT|nr:exported hypothetical protein [uncultured Desulfobacterium sp.]
MRLINIMVSIGWLWAAPALAGNPLPPPCLMQPAYLSIGLPDSGFTWLPGGDLSGSCDDVPRQGWSRKTFGKLHLFVHTDGPAGSGRFCNVTVGISGKKLPNPLRGVCISTSTIGWRTLQRYSKGSLPWLDDLDNDGNAEFILWDSFALHDQASLAEYALMAWVYRAVSENLLVIDWDLSRALARSLAKEYRTPLVNTTEPSRELRAHAAEALDMFAGGQCSTPRVETR